MNTPAPTTETVRPPALLDPVVHGYLLIDESISDYNERFCSMLGRTRIEVVGRSPLDLSPEHQVDGALSSERWTRRWQAAYAGLPQWFHWQFQNRDGARVHALVHLRTDAATSGLVAHVRRRIVVSGRRRIEPALPAWLGDLYERPERVTVLANDQRLIEDFIAARSRA